jgi:hypothetical protein
MKRGLWFLMLGLAVPLTTATTPPGSRFLMCDGAVQLHPLGSERNVRGHFAQPCWHASPVVARLPKMPLLSKAATMILSQSVDRFEFILCRAAMPPHDLGARLPRLFTDTCDAPHSSPVPGCCFVLPRRLSRRRRRLPSQRWSSTSRISLLSSSLH